MVFVEEETDDDDVMSVVTSFVLSAQKEDLTLMHTRRSHNIQYQVDFPYPILESINRISLYVTFLTVSNKESCRKLYLDLDELVGVGLDLYVGGERTRAPSFLFLLAPPRELAVWPCIRV